MEEGQKRYFTDPGNSGTGAALLCPGGAVPESVRAAGRLAEKPFCVFRDGTMTGKEDNTGLLHMM